MNCREEITVRLTDLGSGRQVPLLFTRFCKGPWAGSACELYRNERIENDWAVAIEWSQVTDPEEMRGQRDWLVWALEDLGHVHCVVWQREVGGE
ncbi:hypothetical protein DSLASN_05820 [Desulfoluna limicola]|uniref:Uncharacterized protein n=1 Tax=Desulfoluna limicola TaxID=2810562 RepID=A0ABM7PCY2_9BACT|nr:hypothetical protein [Desulfoluna limicola]BCS94950.1 hypothetical protein DSLASN_05820 [Desulfoluna limicola]